MRWIAGVLAGILVATCCSGCWDKVELEDIAWVQALGADKGPEGYMVLTLEIGVPRGLRGPGGGGAGGGGGGDGGGGAHHITVSMLSKTGLDGLDLAGVNLGRRVSLEHTQAFVLGEEFARADVRGLAAALDRYREVRGTSFVFVARGRAEDVLRVTESPLESSPSRFLATVVQQHQHTGLFETVHLAPFMWEIESEEASPTCPIMAISRNYPGGKGGEGGAVVPDVGERMATPELPPGFGGVEGGATLLEAGQVPIIGGSPVEVMGTALFSGGQMVGDFNAEETRAMLMLKGDFERGAFAIPDPQRPDDPQYSLSVDLREGKTRVHAERHGDRVKIDVRLTLQVSYISIKTQTDYTDPRNTPIAERAIEDYVKKRIDRAIAHAKELKVDPFLFGSQVRQTFWTWPEWNAFAWPTKFPAAEVTTSVKVNIARYGLELAPPDISPTEKLRKGEQPGAGP